MIPDVGTISALVTVAGVVGRAGDLLAGAPDRRCASCSCGRSGFWLTPKQPAPVLQPAE